ncbi:MAG TPA: hypothetical protein VF614_09835, partial [Chthoniobacteraceae bacterium]
QSALMSQRLQAEEHLRVIRSLMEKATIYRAISAPAALIGGLLALLGAAALHFNVSSDRSFANLDSFFLLTWLMVLALAAMSNIAFLHRAARERRELFFSPGMRLALVAMAPGLVSAAFITIAIANRSGVISLPPIWMICYAMALLATSHFAPRSIAILGWCFLVSGLASAVTQPGFIGENGTYSGAIKSGNILMAATFGLYHLIYAACTWPRQTADTTPPVVG